MTPATTGISGTSLGNLTYSPNGQFEYLDTGETGSDSFTYTANDGTVNSSAANVAVTINGVNDAPVAVDDVNRPMRTPTSWLVRRECSSTTRTWTSSP